MGLTTKVSVWVLFRWGPDAPTSVGHAGFDRPAWPFFYTMYDTRPEELTDILTDP